MKLIRILTLSFIVIAILGFIAETMAYITPARPYEPRNERVYTRRPTLVWVLSAHDIEYHVQVSRERNFDSPFFDNIIPADVVRHWVVVDCVAEGTYYWRVKGHYEGSGWSDWEDAYFIVDLSLPPTPTHLRPSYSDIVLAYHNVFDFKWNLIPGQVGYHVQVSDRRDFSNIIAEERKEGDYTRGWYPDNDIQVTLGDVEPGEHYWRVKVQRESGWSDWSTAVNFWLFHKVRLDSPHNGFISRSLSALLKWHSVPTVSQYEVQWSTTDDFSTATSRITTRTNISTDPLDNETTYYWRVKHQGAPWTGKEAIRRFTVRIVPMIPEMIQPSHRIKILPPKPTFKWEHTPYADSYRLEVRKDSSTGRLVFQKSRSVPRIRIRGTGGPTIVSVDSPETLAPGKYCCRIRACNSSGECSGWGVVEFGVASMKKPYHIPKVPKEKLPK